MGSYPDGCCLLLGTDDRLTAEVEGFSIVKSENEKRLGVVCDNSNRNFDKLLLTGMRKNIFACLFSVHNTMSLSRHEQVCLMTRHEQVCLMRLRSERYFYRSSRKGL